MFFHFLMDALVAALAVFGFYCAVKAFVACFCMQEQIKTVVMVRTREDADALEPLLLEASRSVYRCGMGAPVVLISSSLMDGTVGVDEELLDVYADLIDKYGAECYLVDT